MMLAEMVEGLGHRVVAEAGSVDLGRSLAEIEEYDCAILDINLHGFNVRPVAEAVTRRGLPLVFVSGYGAKGVPDGFQGMPVLSKPCSQETLMQTIEAVLCNAEREKTQDSNDRRS